MVITRKLLENVTESIRFTVTTQRSRLFKKNNKAQLRHKIDREALCFTSGVDDTELNFAYFN